MKSKSAFTIVELLIVVSIIAVLSTLSILAYENTQKDSRDSTRKSNVTVISEALEKYYQENGEYPSVASLVNNNGVTAEAVAAKLKISVNDLKMPKLPSGVTNPLTSTNPPPNDQIYYSATSDVNNSNCQTMANRGCDQYTLNYREEDGQVVTVDSRNQGRPTDAQSSADESAAPTIAVTLAAPNVNSTVTAGNACESVGMTPMYTYSYRYKGGNTATWSGWSDRNTYWSATNTFTRAGSQGSSYEYMGYTRCDNGSTPGISSPASPVDSVTYPLSAPTAPTVNIVLNADDTVTATASTVTCAAGATVQYSFRQHVNTAAYSAWSDWSTTTTATQAASEGSTYYYQAKAMCDMTYIDSTEAIGTEDSYSVPVTAPTGLTITATMSGTTAVGTAGGGSCAAGMTLERQIRYEASTTATAGTWQAWVTTNVRNVAAAEGYEYTFQVQARCYGATASSAWTVGGTASTFRPITTAPTAPTLTAATSTADGTVSWTWGTTCPSGTTDQYMTLRTSSETGYNSGWSAATTSQSYTWSNAEGYSLSMQIQARCATTHSATGWVATGTSTAIAPIRTPAAPTGFTYYLRSDRLYDQWTWTNPFCGTGTRAEHYENSYLAGAGWYWVETGQEGWRYGTGWSPVRQYEASPIYGTNNQTPYPSNSTNIKVQHKAFYYCLNTTTRRVSAAGPVGISAYTTVPSW